MISEVCVVLQPSIGLITVVLPMSISLPYQIERDIDRTFPRHLHFEKEGEGTSEGQDSLRNVLQMYARTDNEVGYCQGMAFIAGLLLTYMPEEDAFYCFMAALKVTLLSSSIFIGDVYTLKIVCDF